MISFSQLGAHGRFGNFLFQYAALYSLSKKYNCVIPDLNKEWHGQKCLGSFLNLSLKQSQFVGNNIGEPTVDNFQNIPDNSDLFGYFQDLDYFSEHLNELKQEFSLKNNNIDKLYKEISQGRKMVSIHVRLGDITRENGHYYNSIINGEDYKKFYETAIKQFPDCDFIVFTGGSRGKTEQEQSDIDFCKSIFPNAKFSIGNNCLTDFFLMLNCDGHIISPFSTFSLWVGYLSDKKTVVSHKFENRNLYLERFIKC